MNECLWFCSYSFRYMLRISMWFFTLQNGIKYKSLINTTKADYLRKKNNEIFIKLNFIVTMIIQFKTEHIQFTNLKKGQCHKNSKSFLYKVLL